MNSHALDVDEAMGHEISALYSRFLNSWNERDATAMAALFAQDALLVGFDGSLMFGPQEIEATIGQIFADHQTAPYVGKVRRVRLLAADSALLHAVAGMPCRGQATINPDVNTIQNLVAVRQGSQWRIALLQNTPAQFHGHPELSETLSNELQDLLAEEKTMAVDAIPAGYHTVTPYLIVPDVEGQIAFLKEAFDAEERSISRDGEGGIVHAEVKIGDSVVMMGESNEAFPPMPAMLHLYVKDVDATYERAVAAGATSLREPTNEFYGDRAGGVQDPYGNQWWLATHVEDVSEEEMMRRMAEGGL